MLAVSAQAKKAMIDDLGSAAFMVDLASMERETQYTRTGDLAPTLVARALLLELLQSLSAPLALPRRKQDGHRHHSKTRFLMAARRGALRRAGTTLSRSAVIRAVGASEPRTNSIVRMQW